YFGYLLALVLLNVVVRRANLGQVLDALTAGYRAGRAAQPLLAADWATLWPLPLEEVRARFRIDGSGIVGEGIRAAA
ncbi:MAG: hypothetical protein R3190_18365, partial [Thermoanaerobaculia bacterium]|nr:hypothetical protein [Thermoanaerobaculia bacterium]